MKWLKAACGGNYVLQNPALPSWGNKETSDKRHKLTEVEIAHDLSLEIEGKQFEESMVMHERKLTTDLVISIRYVNKSKK